LQADRFKRLRILGATRPITSISTSRIRADPDTPNEETLAAYAELLAAGKVRAVGASNFTTAQLSTS
jgi:aryl-alcohol dehydrogenase-like predicted oxidoreductase